MSEPPYQPVSDLMMDGKEYQWIFTDEDGKKIPIHMCRIFEDKMIVEMRAKPNVVLPDKKNKKTPNPPNKPAKKKSSL